MSNNQLLDRWLQDHDYTVLGQAVANGYAACDKIMRSTPALGLFAPGVEHRSYLNSIFVQHALMTAATSQPNWHYAINPNTAGNCVHLRLFINSTCAITSHFLGRNNPRSIARPAVNRAVLASVNGDLFSDPNQFEELTHIYCHLLHAGDATPTLAILAVPVENQQNYRGNSVNLILPPPAVAPVEQIADELFFKLKQRADDAKRLANFEPSRLTEARLVRKLSMAEVADKIGVTRQAVSAYENGDNYPSPEILRKLSIELNAPEAFFTMPVIEAKGTVINFRSLAASVKKSREQARVYLEWLINLASYCSQFVELPSARLPTFDIDDFMQLQDEDLEKLAEETRRFFGLGDGPISNLTLLLENHGVMVGFIGLDAGLDGLSAWRNGRPVILISDKMYFARGRFDLAHELAHLVLHRSVVWDDLENKETLAIIESQAHKFASAFLMPEKSFAQEVYGLDETSLVELKRRWGVAMQAIVMRLHAMRFISDDQKTRLFKRISFKGYRRKEPLDDITPPERPKLINRIVEVLDQNKIVLAHEFTLRSRLPPYYVRAVADLPNYEAPLANNIVDFALASSLRRSEA